MWIDRLQGLIQNLSERGSRYISEQKNRCFSCFALGFLSLKCLWEAILKSQWVAKVLPPPPLNPPLSPYKVYFFLNIFNDDNWNLKKSEVTKNPIFSNDSLRKYALAVSYFVKHLIASKNVFTVAIKLMEVLEQCFLTQQFTSCRKHNC